MNQKLLAEVNALGCTSSKDAAIAVQVYLQLTEVKQYWNVKFHYSAQLECMYITAKQSEAAETVAYVPIPTSTNVTFRLMKKYIKLAKSIGGIGACLVVCTSDTTFLYYELDQGLVHPDAASAVKSGDKEREKRNRILLQNEKFLQESAMCGIPITLNRDAEQASTSQVMEDSDD